MTESHRKLVEHSLADMFTAGQKSFVSTGDVKSFSLTITPCENNTFIYSVAADVAGQPMNFQTASQGMQEADLRVVFDNISRAVQKVRKTHYEAYIKDKIVNRSR